MRRPLFFQKTGSGKKAKTTKPGAAKLFNWLFSRISFKSETSRNELNIDDEGEKNWRKKEKNGSSKKSGFEIHFGFFEEKRSRRASKETRVRQVLVSKEGKLKRKNVFKVNLYSFFGFLTLFRVIFSKNVSWCQLKSSKWKNTFPKMKKSKKTN